ncbi:MAG: SUMF1/EgtB/PvdO family nonheme iron enzyme, partial [Bacteroidales bacterium]|nr:SUMF1/EgtB/PvdO family nonheme iron enzyme [Bacteroidales bacterium]
MNNNEFIALPTMNNYIIVALLLFLSVIGKGQDTAGDTPEGMLLIPGGTFLMGSNSSQEIAFPSHPVTLPAFYMDIHEVTNKQYQEFCMSAGYKLPEFWGMDIYKSGLDYPDHPVVGVSQFDASEYADWTGKRLPTEAEWE